jgi:hypothetical protein
MISFCVTSKDRCSLFANSIRSLVSSVRGPAELIVADWQSRSGLTWLPRMLTGTNITYTLLQLPHDEPFSRGRGLNSAAVHARYPCLFFIDTDMLFCSDVFDKARHFTQMGAAYFPICWSYTKPDHSAGRWRDNGKGIVALPRKTYETAQKWDEYQQWGAEDRHFFDRVQTLVPINRTHTKGLYHQWHLPLNSTSNHSRTSRNCK